MKLKKQQESMKNKGSSDYRSTKTGEASFGKAKDHGFDNKVSFREQLSYIETKQVTD